MAALNADLRVVDTTASRYAVGDTQFWVQLECPQCGPSSFLIVAGSMDANSHLDGRLAFLRCVTCSGGMVSNGGVISPGASTLAAVDGCPDDVAAAWAEVRNNLSVLAATSAVMMCRKLLFHIAVRHGLPEKDDRDRAPSFEACLAHLSAVGLVTPKMQPWVKHIKDVGNTANHDLAAITAEEGQRVATFTRQLLVTTYEMPHRLEMLGEPPTEPGQEAGEGAPPLVT